MRRNFLPITLYPIPFNRGLPGFGHRQRSAIARLFSPGVCSELRRNGWVIDDVTPDGCVLRKSVDGYDAKVYVVRVRRIDDEHVEAQGELRLHSMSCGCTGRTLAASDRLREKLWSVLDATEALTVFGDEGDDA